jgi:DNA-binding NarL/FixJ family response regulator
LRRIVISTQNTLLSSMVLRSLRERGDVRAERVSEPQDGDGILNVCRALGADVLFMEASLVEPFTYDARMAAAKRVREALPKCRIALMCDENANPELGERIAMAKRNGEIDNFFYSSVSGEYLAAALEAM